MKTEIVKHTVCVDCLSTTIINVDCRCVTHNNYKTVELEFEVCACCNNILNDGSPAETEFNTQKYKELGWDKNSDL